MRTIKFRGKKIYGDGWAYGLLSDIDERDGIAELGNEYGVEYVHLDTVGQLTGLKDSGGQEIYEGDILTWRSIICEEDHVETWELPVTFYNGCFCLDDDFGMTLISVIYDSEEFGGVKIIGNIHDNPSLLEGGSSD